jgi:hypothetical protein
MARSPKHSRTLPSWQLDLALEAFLGPCHICMWFW